MPTGTASFSNGTRKRTSFLKESSTLRTLSSTLPLLQNTQEWCSGEINPFHRLRRSSSLKANLQLFDVTGVVAARIVHVNADKLNNYKIDDNDGIIAVGDIPQQPPHAPLVVNDTDNGDNTAGSGDDDDDDEDVDGDKDNDNSSDEDDEDNEPAAAPDALEGSKSDSNQGV